MSKPYPFTARRAAEERSPAPLDAYPSPDPYAMPALLDALRISPSPSASLVHRSVVSVLVPLAILSAPFLPWTASAKAAAQDVPERLSLAQALEIARQNNPAYLSVRNDTGVADWEVRSAYASLLPTASVNGGLQWQGAGEQRFGSLTAAQLGFADQPSYYFSSWGMSLGYQLDGETLLRPRSARTARRVTDAEIRASRIQLEQEVTTAYLEALRQTEEVTLAQARLERSRLNLRLARGQRDVGQVTPLDVQQAEVQVGRGEVAVLQARQARATARLRLLQRMGVPLDQEPELSSSFEVAAFALERDELYDMAVEGNPELRVRRGMREQAATDVDIARSRYLPSLSLSAGWSGFTRQPSSTGFLVRQAQLSVAQEVARCQAQNELFRRLADPLPTDDCTRHVFSDVDRRQILEQNDAFPFDFTAQPPSVSLSVSLPLFQGLGRQHEIEAMRASANDATLGIREQELALEADLAIGLGSVRTAYQSYLIEERNQALADEQLRLAREQYGVGLISFVDLVEAETVKAEADQALLAAVYTYHDAVTLLEAVVGAPLRNRGDG